MSKAIVQSKLTQSIRMILLESWDPIGVRPFIKSDYEAIYDEYDSYLEKIEELLNSKASEKEIEIFLLKAEKEQVPSIRLSDRASNAAKLLCNLKT